MLDPIGPLPPGVYWRRRVIAGSVGLTVALLLGWGLIALSGVGAAREVALPPRPGPPVAVAADAPPPQCGDQETRVLAELPRPEFAGTERVGMSIVVTNTGTRPCMRDLNRMLREFRVTTPEGRHIWSSNDCYSESTHEQPLLQPGQSVRNDVVWSGLTSNSRCDPGQGRAPAGDYRLVARLASLNSTPISFRILP